MESVQKKFTVNTDEHTENSVLKEFGALKLTPKNVPDEFTGSEKTVQESGVQRIEGHRSSSKEKSIDALDLQSGLAGSSKKYPVAQRPSEITPESSISSHIPQTFPEKNDESSPECTIEARTCLNDDKADRDDPLSSCTTNAGSSSSALFTQSAESSGSSTQSSSAAGSANASDSSPESSPSPILEAAKVSEQSLDLNEESIGSESVQSIGSEGNLHANNAQPGVDAPTFPVTGAASDDISKGHNQDSLIPIPVIGNRAMLFNLNHIKHLRVLYLLFNGVCYLIDGSKSERELLTEVSQNDEKLDEMDQLFADDVAEQRRLRQLQFEEKMKKLGLDSKRHPRKSNNRGSSETIFVKTLDNDSQIGGLYKRTDSYRDNETVQKVLLSRLLKTATNATLSTIYENFRVFNYMKLNFHHTLLPDPLRYHSHLIVDTRDYYNDDIDMLDITNRGRLATGVKKLWLICGQRRRTTHSAKEKTTELSDPASSQGYRLVTELFGGKEHNPLRDTETVCFSIEWSGFG
ncbi:hypothetical protein HII13_001793 [Brettanomyces bruxellensis]|nr:hypothetical protein HII13_001793 [Brettanomyces bruxellensis]